MNKKKPSVLEVAKEAGVSPATVSRVFNNNLKVNSEMKERVLAAAKKIGYKRNFYAKALIEGKTNFIGLILTRFEIRHYTGIVSAAESVIDDAGYIFIVTSSKYSKQKEQEKITLFSDLNFAGIVIISVGLSDEEIVDISKKSSPLIIFDRKVKGYEDKCIYFDYQGYQKSITELLINKGHKDILHLCGPTRLQVYKEKYNGYIKAMEENHLTKKINYIVSDGATNEAGYNIMKKALKNRKFTAVVCQNDQLAFGAMLAIKEHGLEIPNDISITGFNDVPEAGFTSPSLTTVNFDYTAVGNFIGRKILSEIKREIFTDSVPEFKIIERKSVKTL